jgi:hypothetical protein
MSDYLNARVEEGRGEPEDLAAYVRNVIEAGGQVRQIVARQAPGGSRTGTGLVWTAVIATAGE